jgi:hypothetical protein
MSPVSIHIFRLSLSLSLSRARALSLSLSLSLSLFLSFCLCWQTKRRRTRFTTQPRWGDVRSPSPRAGAPSLGSAGMNTRPPVSACTRLYKSGEYSHYVGLGGWPLSRARSRRTRWVSYDGMTRDEAKSALVKFMQKHCGMPLTVQSPSSLSLSLLVPPSSSLSLPLSLSLFAASSPLEVDLWVRGRGQRGRQ